MHFTCSGAFPDFARTRSLPTALCRCQRDCLNRNYNGEGRGLSLSRTERIRKIIAETSPIPQENSSRKRMTHLMDLIAKDVKRSISKQLLSDCDIWTDNYTTVEEILTQCIAFGERWLKSCKQLTQIFWPNYSSNMWKEEMYEPPDLVKLVDRLREILNIQTLLRQLMRLLTPQEQEELKTNDMFKDFKNLNIFEFGQYATNLWLKTYFEETLLAERQYLLNSLYDYVRHLQSQSSSENTLYTRYDTPQVVADVIIAKQLEAKDNEVLQTSQKLLEDLKGFESLQQMVTELLKDLKQQNAEVFDSWTSEISSLIKEGVLSLKESDPVVQFSKNNKLMRVNYSDLLVTLISEVRQFKALGYHIPSHIDQTSEHAKEFMKLARVLEQVIGKYLWKVSMFGLQIANFHNTIDSRMIKSQRPMMLANTLELSRLVQEEKVVSWEDTKSVEKYVDTLKNAVEKLSKENNLLVSYYYQIMDKIKSLEDVHLIKDYSKWKDVTKHMRNIMSHLEEKYFKNMQTWKVDVDINLCTVLEKKYLRSLDTLHLYLPEIYTNIIYRKSELQFSLDQTVLMEKYQHHLKKFLDIPKSFRGVSENSDHNMFADIVGRSQKDLEKVNKHTEDLFKQLGNHWDLHFRASKTFEQEIAKLPSTEERVGCFLIGLSRLRSDLESHNRNYWDQLVLSLKESIAQDVVKLQNYVDPSTAILTKQPVTLEEVGESGAAHANILKQRSQVEILESGHENRLIQSTVRSLLENHQHIIAKQMATIKTTLNIESENLDKEIKRFSAKWEQIKPKPHTGQIADRNIDELHKQLTGIKEKKEQWHELMLKKEKLFADYDKFDIEKPELMLKL
ncbi:hypothetical protein Zmor_009877 [Zophobas morio]|uniref:Dynein heavy chain tail domain-containing protein n=1 Tax=Zophobas morio TaxID=2755281 RepID=A0AA38MJ89_9CUCU|nr:hypothetical protein Zmor_009877 [Zophobas morio]